MTWRLGQFGQTNREHLKRRPRMPRAFPSTSLVMAVRWWAGGGECLSGGSGGSCGSDQVQTCERERQGRNGNNRISWAAAGFASPFDPAQGYASGDGDRSRCWIVRAAARLYLYATWKLPTTFARHSSSVHVRDTVFICHHESLVVNDIQRLIDRS